MSRKKFPTRQQGTRRASWPKTIETRANSTEELSYRSLSLRKGSPANSGPRTLDKEKRTVEVVAATESPARVYDYDRWEPVNEVLLMSGLQLPKGRQIPLLDSHSRWSSADVLGSARNLRIEGSELITDVVFSTVARGDEALTKLSEGHLTDFSIGYLVKKSVWIPEKQSQVIDGRTFQGPLKVATKWKVKELSITPIGADEQAKARSGRRQETRKEASKMPEWLKKWLEERGLYREDMAEAEARALFDEKEGKRRLPDTQTRTEMPAVKPQKIEKSEEEIRAEGMRAEQARIGEIRSMCDHFGHSDMADQLIKENKPVDEARKIVMDKMMERKPEGPGFLPVSVQIGVEEKEKFRFAAIDSIVIRGGSIIKKPRFGATELAGFSLRELARESLRLAGLPTGGNVLEMVGRALTTSDFPYILAASANKSLFEGWEGAQETWTIWCGTGSVPDFKELSIVRAGEFDDLDEIPEEGEYKYGSRSEAKEAVKIVTYGKKFMISRQAIINDDLGALTDTPKGHGEAAARKVGDLPYAVLTANAAMGDGVALFDAASHGNVGTNGLPGVVTIAEGILLMGLQTDLTGKRRLNIRPVFFLAPRTLEGSCEVFFKSMQYASEAVAGAPDEAFATTRANPYAGSYFTRVYEARLDDNDVGEWYLAGPKGKTVKIFFLDGNQNPYLETRAGWTVDGNEYKVRIDAAAKAVDWRGLVFNAGA